MKFWYNDPQLRSFSEEDFNQQKITLHGFQCSYFRTPYSSHDPLSNWPEKLPAPDRVKETDAGFQLFWDLANPVRLRCHAKLTEVVWNAYALLLEAPLEFPLAFERLQLEIHPLSVQESNQERLRASLLLHV
ncbi:hypothetical protein NYE40_23940 [Paenibacillus sp. FSL W8-1187]|uniref:hypothetical protein n=1 Tax=Paenibacillus sp. FSL W8-1187 TaxID=2975339 RepID=UPI0030D751FE